MITKKNKINVAVIFLILTTLLVGACKDSFNFNLENTKVEGTINPIFAVPLIDAKLTLEQFLPEDDDLNRFLIIDDDGFMTIAYKDRISEYSIEDFLDGEDLSGPSLPFIQYSIDTQILDLNLNDVLSSGNLYLANPCIKLLIINYWDIPAKFRFKDFFYYKEKDSDPIPVTGSAIDEWHFVDQPANIGDSVTFPIILDTLTSNIDEVISALPHHLSFGADFETIPGNPYELPAGSVNKVDLEVKIPLELSLSDILLTDTLDFEIDINTDTAKVNLITINFGAENGFPLGINSQVYFTDKDYIIIDSLFTNRLNLLPAKVSNGIVNESVKTKETIKISSDRMDKILEAKYIIAHALINTTDANSTEVKLYSTYNFGIKLSTLIDVEASL